MANVFSLYNSMLSNTNRIANEALVNGVSPKNDIKENVGLSANDSSFGDMMNEQLDKLNSKQVKADNMVQDFIAGEGDDLHSVMIATEEARISLELAVQLRNKCIESYKEISNMQL